MRLHFTHSASSNHDSTHYNTLSTCFDEFQIIMLPSSLRKPLNQCTPLGMHNCFNGNATHPTSILVQYVVQNKLVLMLSPP